MNCGQLTNAQLDKLLAELARHEDYLSRLRSRMLATGFPVDDKLLNQVIQAHDAMLSLDLVVKLCRAGLHGRSPRARRR